MAVGAAGCSRAVEETVVGREQSRNRRAAIALQRAIERVEDFKAPWGLPDPEDRAVPVRAAGRGHAVKEATGFD